jgi:hypothetical protein
VALPAQVGTANEAPRSLLDQAILHAQEKFPRDSSGCFLSFILRRKRSLSRGKGHPVPAIQTHGDVSKMEESCSFEIPMAKLQSKQGRSSKIPLHFIVSTEKPNETISSNVLIEGRKDIVVNLLDIEFLCLSYTPSRHSMLQFPIF